MDRDQMRQVFWNLFLNAAEAMPAGGTINIDAMISKDLEGGIKQGDRAKIVIADNGSGMTMDNVKRVFEPFFTTKSGGTGLGLAIVYRIIESHGGTIFVDSEGDVGTTFTIFLPVS
jgi:two-component system sensor histidine kinase PilS (NtrC family)